MSPDLPLPHCAPPPMQKSRPCRSACPAARHASAIVLLGILQVLRPVSGVHGEVEAGPGREAGDRRAPATDYFEIRVVDRGTGRGVPLVELQTVHNVRYVTDNAGRIAYREPGHEGQTIFFSIHPQGYRVPKDGFGIEGVRLKIEPGRSAELALERINLAERVYRCTGQELYRDSVLLGYPTPLREPLGSAMVAGQDSVQAAPYRGKLYWFWGDTLRLSYPLGLFRAAGATSELPGGEKGLPPGTGIDFTYFTGSDGFVRAMADVPNPQGVVWLDGVCTVPDQAGRERLVAHFSRRPGLADAYEQGLMVYNDDREVFEVQATLPVDDTWRFLRDHPVRLEDADGEGEYLACGNPFPVTRVKARLADVLDPLKYESWSCLEPGADPEKAAPRRNADGTLAWSWQAGPPVTQQHEARWLKAGLIRAEEARFLPAAGDRPDRRVLMHSGTVRWNAHRRRWIMVAIEYATHKDSPSMLGEVWYSEAESPQGPFRTAVRIVSHDKQSFYNPCHHPFFDEEGGRFIYFEGTYCNTFTHSPPTPRYNYNQVMYRLDLEHPALKAAFPRGQ